MKELRLRPLDLEILKALAGGPTKIKVLIERFDLSRWTLRNHLEKLRRYGLIHWEPYKPIALTPRGRLELRRRLPSTGAPKEKELAWSLEVVSYYLSLAQEYLEEVLKRLQQGV